MNDPAYTIEPRDRALEATHAALKAEIRPGNTVTFLVDVDLTAVEQTRAEAGDRAPTLTAFVVEAVARALRDFPYANRRVHRVRFPWPGPRLQTFHRVDVAVADRGSAVRIVRDADRLTPDAIDAALAGPAAAPETRGARFDPRLWVEERGGAAIVTTPGDDVADAVVGIWSYPIGVAVGRVESRAEVQGDAVHPRPACTLALNFDRRVMAGAPAAWFFRRVVDRLERATVEAPTPAPAPALER